MVTFAPLFFSDLPEIPGKVASVGWISGDTQNYGPGTHFPSLIRMGGAAHWACTDGPTGGRMVRDSPRPHGDFHKGTTTMGCQKSHSHQIAVLCPYLFGDDCLPSDETEFFSTSSSGFVWVFFFGPATTTISECKVRSGRRKRGGGGRLRR